MTRYKFLRNLDSEKWQYKGTIKENEYKRKKQNKLKVKNEQWIENKSHDFKRKETSYKLESRL